MELTLEQLDKLDEFARHAYSWDPRRISYDASIRKSLELVEGPVTDAEAKAVIGACLSANQLYPSEADPFYLVALLCAKKKDTDGAVRNCHAALARSPQGQRWKVLACLGSVVTDLSVAREALLEALATAPNAYRPVILRCLATRELLAGQFRRASEWLDKASALEPELKGLAWLRAVLGFYTGAPWPGVWEEHESRWDAKYTGLDPVPPAKRWDGSPLTGKRVLLAHEGGRGDWVQFIRYASALVSAGVSRLIVSCPPKFERLAETLTAKVDEIHPTISYETNAIDPRVAYDVGIPLMGMPAVFQTTQESVPPVGYFRIPQNRIDAARARIGEGGLRVGIVWRASTADRSFCLSAFGQIAGLPGVKLFSLQRGAGHEGVDASVEVRNARLSVVDLEDGPSDIVGTAAAMCVLDLIITVDSMPAHLAGALARPTFMVTPFVHEWRWLEPERTTSPWYPTMRLFRQPKPGDWAGALAQVAEAVREALSGQVFKRIVVPHDNPA